MTTIEMARLFHDCHPSFRSAMPSSAEFISMEAGVVGRSGVPC